MRSRLGAEWDPERFDGPATFGRLEAEFCRLRAAHPGEFHEVSCVVAGARVVVRVVGDQLANHICRPFSHLTAVSSGQAAELVIDLWDETRHSPHGGSPPRQPRTWTDHTIASHDGRFLAQRLPHTRACLDRRAAHLVAAIAWHERIFVYERAKPLARLLLEWLNGRGVQVLHGGLVGSGDRGVLFAGKSGAGKSTASLACIRAGLEYASEDYIGLERRADGSYVGHSVYNSVFLEHAQIGRFDDLQPYVIRGNPPEEMKSVIILSEVFPERLRQAIPIDAVAILRVAGTARSAFRPASKAAALLALGPSSLLQLPNRSLGARGLEVMAQLVERVPCFWLDVGTDLGSLADSVRDLLAQPTHGAGRS